MNNRRRTVLIAESNWNTAQGFRVHLEWAGFTVLVARDADQAAILAARQRYELIIVNLDLPGSGGIEFCRHVREDLGLTDVPLIACAKYGEEHDEEALKYRYGISRLLHPPVDPKEMVNFAQESMNSLATAS